MSTVAKMSNVGTVDTKQMGGEMEEMKMLATEILPYLTSLLNTRIEESSIATPAKLIEEYDTMRKNAQAGDKFYEILEMIRNQNPLLFDRLLQLHAHLGQLHAHLERRNLRGGMDREHNGDGIIELGRGVIQMDFAFYRSLLISLTAFIVGLWLIITSFDILNNTVDELGINTSLLQLVGLLAYPSPGTIAELINEIAIGIKDDAVVVMEGVCSPAGYNGWTGVLLGYIFGNSDCGIFGLNVVKQQIEYKGAKLQHGMQMASTMAYRGFGLFLAGGSGTLLLIDSQYNGRATGHITAYMYSILGPEAGGWVLANIGIPRDVQINALQNNRFAIEDARRGGKRKSRRRNRKSKQTKKGRKGKKGKKGRKSRRKH